MWAFDGGADAASLYSAIDWETAGVIRNAEAPRDWPFRVRAQRLNAHRAAAAPGKRLQMVGRMCTVPVLVPSRYNMAVHDGNPNHSTTPDCHPRAVGVDDDRLL